MANAQRASRHALPDRPTQFLTTAHATASVAFERPWSSELRRPSLTYENRVAPSIILSIPRGRALIASSSHFRIAQVFEVYAKAGRTLELNR